MKTAEFGLTVPDTESRWGCTHGYYHIIYTQLCGWHNIIFVWPYVVYIAYRRCEEFKMPPLNSIFINAMYHWQVRSYTWYQDIHLSSYMVLFTLDEISLTSKRCSLMHTSEPYTQNFSCNAHSFRSHSSTWEVEASFWQWHCPRGGPLQQQLTVSLQIYTMVWIRTSSVSDLYGFYSVQELHQGHPPPHSALNAKVWLQFLHVSSCTWRALIDWPLSWASCSANIILPVMVISVMSSRGWG